MITFQRFIDGSWKGVDVESHPEFSDTLDESFDTCQIVLKANQDKDAYAPDEDIRMIEDDGTIRVFVIASDEVSVASAYPLMYKHTLTLAQNISKWKKFLIRNCSFTQPSNDRIKGKCAAALLANDGSLEWQVDPYSISIPTDGHMKVSKARHRWDFKITRYDRSSRHFKTWSMDVMPKGRMVAVDPTTGQEFVLIDFSRNIPAKGQWMDMPFEEEAHIRRLAGKGPIKIVYDNGYLQGEQILPPEYQTRFVGSIITIEYEVECDVHYHTMLDVLSSLREMCAQKVNSVYRKPIPFELPDSTSELYGRLRKDIAPNFTWTQSTLYEALEEFFSYYDSVMTLDENNVIGMESMEKTGRNITSDITGYSSASSTNERVNGMVNFYSRSRQKVCYPDERGSLAPLRSVTLGVPSESDFSIVLPEPIDSITKVEVFVSDYQISDRFDQADSTRGLVQLNLDITDRFIEDSVWQQLPQSVPSSAAQDRRFDSLGQFNTISYSKGSKAISLSKRYGRAIGTSQTFIRSAMNDSFKGFFGIGRAMVKDLRGNPYRQMSLYMQVDDIDYPEDENWAQFKIRIQYIAQTQGKVRAESPENKVSREMISTQGGADCDITKLGKMMQGLLRRTGNETRSVTFPIADWTDKSPKKGDSYQGWVISKLDHRILPDGKHIAVAELSKNFNRLSMRTKIDRAKRMTNVSNELVQDCEDILTEYAYVTTNDRFPSEDISIGSNALSAMFSPNPTRIDASCVTTYGSDGWSVGRKIAIPLRKYRFGSCLCFEMRYDSPMSAGNQMEITTGWFGTQSYYSKPVLYADNAGFFDSVWIDFFQITVEEWAYEYPKVDDEKIDVVGEIRFFEYGKRPNEAFGLNYELCVIPDPTDDSMVVGEAFYDENPFTGQGWGEFRFFCDSKGGYEPDVAADGEEQKIEVVVSLGNGGHSIISPSMPKEMSNWALTDMDGNVIVASNKPTESEGNAVTFYIATSKFRL